MHTAIAMESKTIDILDGLLDEHERNCRSILDDFKHSERKEADVSDVRDQLKSMKRKLDLLERESKNVRESHPLLHDSCKKKIRTHQSMYTELYNEFNRLQAAHIEVELVTGFHSPSEVVATDLMTSGLDTQDRSKAVLINTLGVVLETKEFGVRTADKLRSQTEQIESIERETDIVESTVQRSMAITRRIAGKMMRDKCLWVVTFLLLAMIIFVIVYSQYHNTGANTPNTWLIYLQTVIRIATTMFEPRCVASLSSKQEPHLSA